jgi:hypothetical protein
MELVGKWVQTVPILTNKQLEEVSKKLFKLNQNKTVSQMDEEIKTLIPGLKVDGSGGFGKPQ